MFNINNFIPMNLWLKEETFNHKSFSW